MLSLRISSWSICSACALRSEHAMRNSISEQFLKQRKCLKIAIDCTNKWSKPNKKFFGPNTTKILLKIRLSTSLGKFAAPNEALNIIIKKFLPQSRPPKETLWCKKHENPTDWKSHTWTPWKTMSPLFSSSALPLWSYGSKTNKNSSRNLLGVKHGFINIQLRYQSICLLPF